MVVEWPRRILKPRDVAISLAGASVSGPASLSGFRQTVAAPSARWQFGYSGFPVNTPAAVKLWRALAAQIEGRLNPILLPVFDRKSLRPFANGADGDVLVSHSDESEFGDGSAYEQSPISVDLAANLALGAVTATLTRVLSDPIEAGQHFSIGERLYIVRKVTSQTSTTAAIEFFPPARAAAPAGTHVEFAYPVCKVRLLDEAGMELPLSFGRYGQVAVQFVEDPT